MITLLDRDNQKIEFNEKDNCFYIYLNGQMIGKEHITQNTFCQYYDGGKRPTLEELERTFYGAYTEGG